MYEEICAMCRLMPSGKRVQYWICSMRYIIIMLYIRIVCAGSPSLSLSLSLFALYVFRIMYIYIYIYIEYIIIYRYVCVFGCDSISAFIVLFLPISFQDDIGLSTTPTLPGCEFCGELSDFVKNDLRRFYPRLAPLVRASSPNVALRCSDFLVFICADSFDILEFHNQILQQRHIYGIMIVHFNIF